MILKKLETLYENGLRDSDDWGWRRLAVCHRNEADDRLVFQPSTLAV